MPINDHLTALRYVPGTDYTQHFTGSEGIDSYLLVGGRSF